jgi:hypothetical protein
MSAIQIKLECPFVEELFTQNETVNGNDLPGYRNTVYCAITKAMHFLGNADERERLNWPVWSHPLASQDLSLHRTTERSH